MNTVACDISSGVCTTCGVPVDSEHFDESGFAALPDPGREVRLAHFDLRHQYCGVLDCFSQFTDTYGRDPSAVETPDLEWLLLVNRRPLHPYVNIRAIVNPWGFVSFGARVRLPEAAKLELVVRRSANAPASSITRVGGRIAGRYWFNSA